MQLPTGIRNMRYDQDMAIVRTKFQWVILILFFAILFTLPLFSNEVILYSLITCAILVISVQGLLILTGLTGQISLGQAALMLIGGYTAAVLFSRFGISFWALLPLGGIGATLVGILFGLPSLRVKGLYLALSTLALHMITVWIIYHNKGIFGGENGLSLALPSLIASTQTFYYFVMVITIIMCLFVKNLMRTDTGRAFIAIRDNDIAAEVMGVNLAKYKLLAFAMCSFYAGIAGVLSTGYMGIIDPSRWSLMDAILYLAMLMIGGIGSSIGPIFGVLFFRLLDSISLYFSPLLANLMPQLGSTPSAALTGILYGLVIIAFLVLEPRGLVHRWEIIKRSVRIWPFGYV